MILMNGLRGGQRRSRVIGIRRVSHLCWSVFFRGAGSSVARVFSYSVFFRVRPWRVFVRGSCSSVARVFSYSVFFRVCPWLVFVRGSHVLYLLGAHRPVLRGDVALADLSGGAPPQVHRQPHSASWLSSDLVQPRFRPVHLDPRRFGR